ncbi:hypothetical protein, partial [Xenorhabdus sp. IM139775]|uniref:hypothetical protein n=1 Tax=Xenorhabdus sp. IM139775 TaxID=3025876 RepID=UPI003FD5E1D6
GDYQYVFPSRTDYKKPLSEMAMNTMMKRMGDVGIPAVALQQMLNPIRCALAYPFSQLPAIFTFNITEQSFKVGETALLWAGMGETRGPDGYAVSAVPVPKR